MKIALKIFHNFSDVEDNRKCLVRLVHLRDFPYTHVQLTWWNKDSYK